MTIRAILLLLGLTLANAGADAGTYQRTQDFAVFPMNWRQSNPRQYFGYQPGGVTGGRGAAGGLFLPHAHFNFYADVFLGGALPNIRPISAQGRLTLKRVSAQPPYVTSAYIGHFGAPVGAYIDTVGIALTGTGEDFLTAAAIVEFSNGDAYRGRPINVPVGAGIMDWSYAWDPAGGRNGTGSLRVQVGGLVSGLELPEDAAGSSFAVNAFGLFQPPFVSPRSNSFLWAYVGNLAYTAGVGEPPTLRVSGRRNSIVRAPDIFFHGSASVKAQGYELRSVRYRTVHNGATSAFHPARGLERWSVGIHLRPGLTRVQFLATSSGGATRLIERQVFNRRRAKP